MGLTTSREAIGREIMIPCVSYGPTGPTFSALLAVNRCRQLCGDQCGLSWGARTLEHTPPLCEVDPPRYNVGVSPRLRVAIMPECLPPQPRNIGISILCLLARAFLLHSLGQASSIKVDPENEANGEQRGADHSLAVSNVRSRHAFLGKRGRRCFSRSAQQLSVVLHLYLDPPTSLGRRAIVH